MTPRQLFIQSICVISMATASSCSPTGPEARPEVVDIPEERAEDFADRPLELAEALIPLDAPVDISQSGMTEQAKYDFLECLQTNWDGPILFPWENGFDNALSVLQSDCAYEVGLDEWVPLWIPDDNDSEMYEEFAKIARTCIDELGLPQESLAELEPGFYDIDWDIVDSVDPTLAQPLADCLNDESP